MIVLAAPRFAYCNAPATQLANMKSQLATLDAQIARAEKLLRIADPDGWLQHQGTKAAQVCVM
jgi:hypothetical protein